MGIGGIFSRNVLKIATEKCRQIIMSSMEKFAYWMDHPSSNGTLKII